MSDRPRRVSRIVSILLVVPFAVPGTALFGAQAAETTTQETKAFEGAVTFSQSLSAWALLIVGGSIVILVGTSYYRPRQWWARLMYTAFLPGWCFLGRSMYFGVNVQRAYLGFLFLNPTGSNVAKFKGAVNDDSLRQILGIQHAIYCFGIWLLLYLVWWMFNRDPQRAAVEG